jgi:serine/threonine-protein kinase
VDLAFHQCLGRGGFGEVYLATARQTGGLRKHVAVKVLRDDVPDHSDAVQRLLDEGRMLGFLNHPCILRVLEVMRIENRLALVFEYVAGVDVSKLAAGKLPQRLVLSVIGEVAGALHTAYTTPHPDTGNPLHLVHRDIKPQNIRISVHGEVKLLDFGIARSPAMRREAQTTEGSLPFTPGYASPESLIYGKQGPEGDIYALGVTLLRLLTGQRFYGKAQLADQVRTAAKAELYDKVVARRLAEVESTDTLKALLRRMLSHKPEDRPSAIEVQSVCEDLADEMAGPTLRRWARDSTFPPVSVDTGSLSGQVIAGKQRLITLVEHETEEETRTAAIDVAGILAEEGIDGTAATAVPPSPSTAATGEEPLKSSWDQLNEPPLPVPTGLPRRTSGASRGKSRGLSRAAFEDIGERRSRPPRLPPALPPDLAKKSAAMSLPGVRSVPGAGPSDPDPPTGPSLVKPPKPDEEPPAPSGRAVAVVGIVVGALVVTSAVLGIALALIWAMA